MAEFVLAISLLAIAGTSLALLVACVAWIVFYVGMILWCFLMGIPFISPPRRNPFGLDPYLHL